MVNDTRTDVGLVKGDRQREHQRADPDAVQNGIESAMRDADVGLFEGHHLVGEVNDA